MRLIFVSRDLDFGGAENQISILSRHMDAEVFLFLYAPVVRFSFRGNLLSADIYRSRARVFLPFLRALKLAKARVLLKPDAVLSFAPHTNVVNIISGLLSRKGKTIISVRTLQSRGLEYLGTYGKIYFHLLRSLSKFADLCVCPTGDILDDFVKNFNFPPHKARVIPNACDIKYIRQKANSPDPRVKKIAELLGRKFVISVGRLIPQKNYFKLLRAWRYLKAEFGDYKLAIVGDGPLFGKLFEYARELGLVPADFEKVTENFDVIFTGSVQNPWYLLSGATAFVLTSDVEGFPNVLLEAMALGVPAVAVSCSSGVADALGEHVDFGFKVGKCGVVVGRGDDGTHVALALKTLLSDENLRNKISLCARKRVKLFSPEKIARMWIDTIREVAVE